MQPWGLFQYRTWTAKPISHAALIGGLTLGSWEAVTTHGLIASFGLFLGMVSLGLLLVSSRIMRPISAETDADDLTQLAKRRELIARLDRWLRRHRKRQTVVLLIEIDQFHMIEEAHDRTTVEDLLRDVAQRLRQHLRDQDIAARLEGPSFAIALAPTTRLTFESVLQLSARLQHALNEPFSTPQATVRLTASIGFAMADRIKTRHGEALMRAATSALIEAQRNGPGAVRSFSDLMRERIETRNALVNEVGRALREGEITAFFQPQMQLETGELTGFETLTRWQHPDRGLISPADFLPAMQQARRMEDLGNLMVAQALDALCHWDALGHKVPRVGVNFSSTELRNPHLVSRIALMLETRNLSPDRLVIEVLETVVATASDDAVARNLAGLADLGCGIDLDDFGTGYASITNIRRLSIERIKIDRSFITRIDSDTEQQDMVSAILTMADRLGLETLAEGVETPGERRMLANLGCQFAQGFLFGRPMPLAETADWIVAQSHRNAEAIPLHRHRA